ncbi:hypothetical protein OL229_09595 [Neisseriaceae bacterium JH1-16]|nr:hypothetical protein [Neisseriaceae bacterium JH1-16]
MPNRTTTYHYRARYGQTLANRRWARSDWQLICQELAESAIAPAELGQSTAAFVRRHNRQASLLRAVAARPGAID